ncbi:two-component system response regulator [Paenibacillus sp. Soil766]|uniref:response regulator n=1 Tax=Paenibacillus sp. Soil766 TaxID=1736404 RepID=UPI00070E4AC4|nr:response regulator [Paenibacillus sp. Soil766]KRF08145.1 two-component system response regulator [Paenibacillus sp. Soil766]
MIRVLIVDDEKIVRKGLVSFMPWQDFGMVVAGEANNGENALQFMETNRVDLLLTDLSMPVMSGIELMREVRQRHPHIQIVVLTLHQDFEYVQEALRLGAIDYIAKTQLEKEQFEDVLRRIASLMDKKDSFNSPPIQQYEIGRVDELFVLYALHQQSDEMKSGISLPLGAVEADVGVWYWTDMLPNAISPNPNYALICFKDLKDMDRKSLLRLLRVYRKNDLFYDYDPTQSLQFVHSGSILSRGNDETGYEMNTVKQRWLSSEWILDDQVFDHMIQELRAMKLQPIRLTRIFFSLTDEWNRLYHQILSNPIVVEDFFSSWVQFEAWLRDSRETIRQANSKPQYSIEIQNSIAKAMTLAQQMMDQPVSAGEMAKMVNMSSSYFSQCFKQIAGQNYTDYIRDIRMERAKEYLKNTTKTIQWIAEQIGYNDEKYFSRLFRDQVGVLPSDYRQRK